MTDIVERLRQQAADNPHDTAYNARCTEAADEIERLRAGLRSIASMPLDWPGAVGKAREVLGDE